MAAPGILALAGGGGGVGPGGGYDFGSQATTGTQETDTGKTYNFGGPRVGGIDTESALVLGGVALLIALVYFKRRK
jgi:hypothetical protein